MAISLIEYLEESARRFPEKLAVSDEKLELSFSQLRQRARQVGSFLARRFPEKNRPICVETDRATESIVLFLGVLYSGNFYVPVDNKLPLDRVGMMVEDVDPLGALTFGKKTLFGDGVSVFRYEDILREKTDEDLVDSRSRRIIDVDPCYMIYTSGSTGRPKGVVISHRMMMDFGDFLSLTFGISHEDVLGNQAPFYFDCSVKCLTQMLRNGSTMYILRPTYFMFPIRAVEFMNEKKITTLLWATSGLNILSSSGVLEKRKPRTLKKIFFSGEPLYGKNLHPWQKACPPDTLFVNLYGPTEVTVDCTYQIIRREYAPEEPVPIGIPCRNMEVFLLNEEGERVPAGEIGEICARGTGISYGYYNNPSKTREVFVQNPFTTGYRDIIYRTGDLGRWNDEGELVYISRKDNQVKHMGNRIELGELEAAAMAATGVKEAVAFYDGEKRKIVLCIRGNAHRKDVLLALRSRLPKYMEPGVLLLREDFPTNRNGKVDRVALRKEYFEKRD